MNNINNNFGLRFPLVKDFFNQSTLFYFITISTILASVVYMQSLLVTDHIYFNSFGEQLTRDHIQGIINSKKEWLWLSYLLIPIILATQATLIGICINTGSIIADYKISFKQIFSISLKSMIIIAIGRILNIASYLFSDINTFEDLQNADIFSLLGIIGYDSVPTWLQYPLQIINVFELLFVVLLAAGMSYLVNKPYKKMLIFILSTYGLGLLIWTLFIVFIQLNISI